jgi:hypothetical protein
MDPIPDPLTPTIRTDGTALKVLARDLGKANEITVQISMENFAEICVMIDAFVTIRVDCNRPDRDVPRKHGLLIVSPPLKVGRDQLPSAHICDLSHFQP